MIDNSSCDSPRHIERLVTVEAHIVALDKACAARDNSLRREILLSAQNEERAQELADANIQQRLKSLNEWNETFRDMRDRYLERTVFDQHQERTSENTERLEERIGLTEQQLAAIAGINIEHKNISIKIIMIMGIIITVINIVVDFIIRTLTKI